MRATLRGLAAVFALLAAGAGTAQEVGTAARVNGVEISVFRLERYFQDYLQEQGRNVQMMTNPGVYKRLKREALDQLVDAELLWQEAQKENLVASADEARAAVGQSRKRFRSDEAFRHRLGVAGFTEESYLEYLRREISGQRYVDRHVAPVSVPDEAVHEFYVANPEFFKQPEGPLPEAGVRERVRGYLLALARRDAARLVIDSLRAKARIEILLPL